MILSRFFLLENVLDLQKISKNIFRYFCFETLFRGFWAEKKNWWKIFWTYKIIQKHFLIFFVCFKTLFRWFWVDFFWLKIASGDKKIFRFFFVLRAKPLTNPPRGGGVLARAPPTQIAIRAMDGCSHSCRLKYSWRGQGFLQQTAPFICFWDITRFWDLSHLGHVWFF